MGARPFHVGISLSFGTAASSSSDQQLKSSAAQHLKQFPTRGVGSGLSPAQFWNPRVTWFPTLAIVLDSRGAWFWTLAARVPDSWECSSRLSWAEFPTLLLSSRLQFLDSRLPPTLSYPAQFLSLLILVMCPNLKSVPLLNFFQCPTNQSLMMSSFPLPILAFLQ